MHDSVSDECRMLRKHITSKLRISSWNRFNLLIQLLCSIPVLSCTTLDSNETRPGTDSIFLTFSFLYSVFGTYPVFRAHSTCRSKQSFMGRTSGFMKTSSGSGIESPNMVKVNLWLSSGAVSFEGGMPFHPRLSLCHATLTATPCSVFYYPHFISLTK